MELIWNGQDVAEAACDWLNRQVLSPCQEVLVAYHKSNRKMPSPGSPQAASADVFVQRKGANSDGERSLDVATAMQVCGLLDEIKCFKHVQHEKGKQRGHTIGRSLLTSALTGKRNDIVLKIDPLYGQAVEEYRQFVCDTVGETKNNPLRHGSRLGVLDLIYKSEELSNNVLLYGSFQFDGLTGIFNCINPSKGKEPLHEGGASVKSQFLWICKEKNFPIWREQEEKARKSKLSQVFQQAGLEKKLVSMSTEHECRLDRITIPYRQTKSVAKEGTFKGLPKSLVHLNAKSLEKVRTDLLKNADIEVTSVSHFPSDVNR